jgi:large subunit ribosomal protein L6
MSRVGKKPVEIPQGVTVQQEGRRVTVKGPKGTLEYTVPDTMKVSITDSQITVEPVSESPVLTALFGTTRAQLANLVKGVTEGFSKTLEILGTGYRAQVEGKKLVLHLGYSMPKEYGVPEGIEIAVEGNTKIQVSGISKQHVGQVAAEIRALRPPEPYKGKGVRLEGEYVRRKAGKSAGA